MLRYFLPALLISAPAAAQEVRPYVKVEAGEVWDADSDALHFPSSDDGTSYGFGAGIDWRYLRFEVGYDRIRTARFESERLHFSNFHATIYGQLPVTDRLTMFAGTGIDQVSLDFFAWGDDHAYNERGDGHHWTAGGAYRVSDHFTADLQYRRIELEYDEDEFAPGGDDVNLSLITAGLRYMF